MHNKVYLETNVAKKVRSLIRAHRDLYRSLDHINRNCINLRKGQTIMKHSLHGKVAASVVSKLFINGNANYHTTDAPNT